MTDLKQEFEFYQKNKADFLAKYKGKFIVIKQKNVIGTFDNEMEAVNETKKTHPLGTFLVQHVIEDDDTAFFYSRVSLKNVRSA